MKSINKIKNSIYNPVFYNTISQKPFSQALVYYLKFISILALVLTIIISIFLVPALTRGLDILRVEFTNTFPAELEIKIAEGETSINLPEPYIISWPRAFGLTKWTNKPKSFFVIDTTVVDPLQSIDDYDTYVLLTKESLAYRQETNSDLGQQITVWQMDEDVDLVVNQAGLMSLIDHLNRYLFIISPALVFIFFVGLWLGLLSLLLWLFLIVALLWLIYLWPRDKENRLSYITLYKTALYALTIGLLGKILFIALGINFPFLLSLVTMVIILINIPLVIKNQTGEVVGE